MKLIEGANLTEQQRQLLTFNGMTSNEWVNSHAFYFENDQPSQKEGFYYPVGNPSKELLDKFL